MPLLGPDGISGADAASSSAMETAEEDGSGVPVSDDPEDAEVSDAGPEASDPEDTEVSDTGPEASDPEDAEASDIRAEETSDPEDGSSAVAEDEDPAGSAGC